MVEDLIGISLPFLLILVGIGLAIAEAIAPGAHFIVLGVALIVAGVFGLLASSAGLALLATPIALAIVVLLVSALSLFVYREFDFYGGKGAGRTTDSDSLTGKIGYVTERVTQTSGEVKLDGGGFNPYYRARSMRGEIEEGTEVIVVDPGGGNVVTVESMEAIDDIDRELERARAENETAAESADAETDSLERETK